ncbi:hypothetical protein HanRHA438_Chr03g0128431 [Helianthus annuus]|nr:hypothetical protein HanRHA438_Chr03g0128431 [Helianthus annuus]
MSVYRSEPRFDDSVTRVVKLIHKTTDTRTARTINKHKRDVELFKVAGLLSFSGIFFDGNREMGGRGGFLPNEFTRETAFLSVNICEPFLTDDEATGDVTFFSVNICALVLTDDEATRDVTFLSVNICAPVLMTDDEATGDVTFLSVNICAPGLTDDEATRDSLVSGGNETTFELPFKESPRVSESFTTL